MEAYSTLTEAIEELRKEGYVEDFNLKKDCLECGHADYRVLHDEFEIDKFYRFEGDTDPADEAVLYAISSDKYKLKGVLVSAYGIYSEPLVDQMVRKLTFDH